VLWFEENRSLQYMPPCHPPLRKPRKDGAAPVVPLQMWASRPDFRRMGIDAADVRCFGLKKQKPSVHAAMPPTLAKTAQGWGSPSCAAANVGQPAHM